MSLQTLHITEIPVPVKVYVERSLKSSATIRKNSVVIRISALLSKNQQQQQVEEYVRWAKKTIAEKKIFSNHKAHQSGAILKVMEAEWQLVLQNNSGNKTLTKLLPRQGDIHISLPEDLNNIQRHLTIKKALSRIFAKYYLDLFARRVDELNDQYFQKDIGRISLKYTSSRWGSCSSNKNLSFSTRLLLATPKVRDYVIIHELAHLMEMNHSDRFWKIIEKIMPDYQLQEKWLKAHGAECDF